MSNPARKRAKAFHALGTQELRFELFLFSDIGVDDQFCFRLARAVAHE
ncbi:MAG TPA: hypothetical protein VFW05_10115 [Verrucomicrobiae bacterium]|nr:hypothetical protein [Verrucomicrobiae bacterium]